MTDEQKKKQDTKAKTPKKQTSAKKAAVEMSMEIPVYGVDGKESKKIELSKELFTSEASPKVIGQYIRVYLANQRQGNASTKLRSEVIGTTAKVYRQKGTGRARHGSKKANLFVGGGVTFGPKPKDFSLRMNKKQKRQALIYVLAMKLQEGAVAALADEVLSMKPKTKTVASMIKNMKMTDTKTLIVVPTMETRGLLLAARNLSQVKLIAATTINPYLILGNDKIVFVEKALEVMSTHFKTLK